QAKPQAEFNKRLYYGPITPAAFEFIPKDLAVQLPTYADNLAVSVRDEDDWLGEPWTTPETVVMVHGNSESSRAWTMWVPHLSGRYRVIRPDLPGFGASSEPPGYGWSAQELAA